MTTTPSLRRLAAALAAAAALLLPAAAGAQTGNQTDNGFPLPIGGSGAIGGSYLGPGLRTENELFQRLRGDVRFRDTSIGCAVRGATEAYADSASRVDCGEAARLVNLVIGVGTEGRTSSLAAQLADAISRGADPRSEVGRAARALADALTNLFRRRGGCAADIYAYTEAEDWYEALRAYNRFVAVAPDSVLSPPSEELLVIHAALHRVVTAGVQAARAR
ncbi:MAG TPA: hypothetical protein VHG91_02495 [Longimicrobium sp.]|nr:hypothetical protein [Longimicrobium sp.]